MNAVLLLIALFTLGTAAFALTRRNLIHAALLLIASWAGLAAFYLWAGAEFVAFAQVLVYVGAVSMVVLFAVLLTRRDRLPESAPISLGRVTGALFTGVAVASLLGGSIFATHFGPTDHAAPPLTVRQIGRELMGPHVLALLITGVVLTVALLGAVVIAATYERENSDDAA